MRQRPLLPWLLLSVSWWAQVAAATPADLQQGAVTLTTVAPNCAYGAPIVDGDTVLIPKVCRHDMAGKPVIRHSVEVKALATGARIQQASLPPTAATSTDLPEVGTLLAGSPPLLVTSAGIAGIEPRAGKAEPAFEPEGALVAVARHDNLLAVADRRPRDTDKAKLALEITVLDLAAGEVIGQALFADEPVQSFEFSNDGRALRMALGKKTPLIDIAVLGRDGKPATTGGRLTSRKLDLPVPAQPLIAQADPGFCRLIRAQDHAQPGAAQLQVRVAPNVPQMLAYTSAAWSSNAKCVAVIEVLGKQGPLWLAWIEGPGGVRELKSAVPTGP